MFTSDLYLRPCMHMCGWVYVAFYLGFKSIFLSLPHSLFPSLSPLSLCNIFSSDLGGGVYVHVCTHMCLVGRCVSNGWIKVSSGSIWISTFGIFSCFRHRFLATETNFPNQLTLLSILQHFSNNHHPLPQPPAN